MMRRTVRFRSAALRRLRPRAGRPPAPGVSRSCADHPATAGPRARRRRPRRRGAARHQRPGTALRLRPRTLPPGARLTVHVVDPAPPGAGRVWRTAQSARAADEHRGLAGDPVHRRQRGLRGPDTPGPEPVRVGGTRTPTRRLGPDDYPTRAPATAAIWSGSSPQVRAQAPARGDGRGAPGPRRCGSTRPPDGRADPHPRRRPTVLTGLSAVVLAQGHLPVVADADAATPRRLRRPRTACATVPPANPADVDLSPRRPGRTGAAARPRPQLLRPHGAADDGPRRPFRPRPTTGALRYLPSGREPRLYAGSRRGIPYQARGDNAKGPHGRHHPLVLTAEVIAGFRKRADSGEAPDFLHRDMAAGGEGGGDGLLRGAAAARCGRRPPLATSGTASSPRPHRGPEEAAVLDGFGDRAGRPLVLGPDRRGRTRTRSSPTPAACRDWLLGHLREDAAQAALGNVAGPAEGGPGRAARPAQRAAADRRPRRARRRLPPGPPGPLVHPAQRLPVHRPAAAPRSRR